MKTYFFQFLIATFSLFLLNSCKKDDKDPSGPEPVILTMNPASGPKGTLVTLTGENFGSDISAVSVYVNGKQGNVISITPASIEFEVPPRAGDGAVTVSVSGNGASGPDFDFIYTITVSTFSGSGSQGMTNGSALNAKFNGPRGLAIDKLNNLYVADEMNNCIRKITTSGTVTTFAGTAIAGHADGGPAVAKFNHPYDIVYDSVFNYFYVADRNNHCIRKISALGDVVTVAGIPGTAGYVDAPGNSARFNFPTGVAVTGEEEKIFVADAGNHCIRRIDNLGIVTTFAGSTTPGNSNGTGSSAGFSSPYDITWDSDGYLIVSDINNHNIRKINTNALVTTIGGVGMAGFQDGASNQSLFNTPKCAVAEKDELFICDAQNNRLRQIENGEVATIAGSGASGAVNGDGAQARFNNPTGIVRDSDGNLFISDCSNHIIRKITIN